MTEDHPFQDEFGPLDVRLPPEMAFVSLSHAISWIALRHSVAGYELSQLLRIGTRRSPDQTHCDRLMDAKIANGLRLLTDLGSDGLIKFRAQWFRDVLDDPIEILTEQVQPVRLADFRWFDTLDDCLFRGFGLAWGENRQELLYPDRADYHFRFVTVRRADLLTEFPVERSQPANGLTQFTDSEIDEWIRLSAYTGMKRARNEFMLDRRAKGLSAVFEKRWNTIKQNRIGRPRKQ